MKDTSHTQFGNVGFYVACGFWWNVISKAFRMKGKTAIVISALTGILWDVRVCISIRSSFFRSSATHRCNENTFSFFYPKNFQHSTYWMCASVCVASTQNQFQSIKAHCKQKIRSNFANVHCEQNRMKSICMVGKASEIEKGREKKHIVETCMDAWIALEIVLTFVRIHWRSAALRVYKCGNNYSPKLIFPIKMCIQLIRWWLFLLWPDVVVAVIEIIFLILEAISFHFRKS